MVAYALGSVTGDDAGDVEHLGGGVCDGFDDPRVDGIGDSISSGWG